MREAKIEQHLRERVLALGGQCYKFVSPMRPGVPDRIVLLPGGILVFVELKAPSKRPEPHQEREHRRMRALDQRVEVLDSIDAVDEFLRGLG